MISKWRRPKPVEADAKAADLEQPLTIAAAQNDAQPSDETADSASPSASQSHSAQLPADSEDADLHRLDSMFTDANSNDASKNLSAGETKANRAPYAPDPIGLSNASGTAVDDRTVMAPEADGERGSLPGGRPTAPPSGQPTPPPIGLVDRDQNTAANVGAVPGQPHDLAGRPAAESPGKPTAGGQSNAVYGISDHAGASQTPAGRLSQDTAEASPSSQRQEPANSKNVNLVEWNRPTPVRACGRDASSGFGRCGAQLSGCPWPRDSAGPDCGRELSGRRRLPRARRAARATCSKRMRHRSFETWHSALRPILHSLLPLRSKRRLASTLFPGCSTTGRERRCPMRPIQTPQTG